MPKLASPLAGKTIDRRAGCGRSARPVRREGVSNPIGAPYPYQEQVTEISRFPLSRERRAEGACAGCWEFYSLFREGDGLYLPGVH